MRKVFIILVLLTCTLLGCSNIKTEENRCQFNDMYWLTDREDVIKEKGEPISYASDNSLQYYEQFMDKFFIVNYYFDEDNKLDEISIDTEGLLAYDDIKSEFVEKFGEPEEVATNDAVRDASWFVNNTYIAIFEFAEKCKVYYSFFSNSYLTDTVEVTTEANTEANTNDTLKYEVADTYNKIWNMVDKTSDLWGSSINSISDYQNDIINKEELLNITSNNYESVEGYIEEITKYFSEPVYDDEFATAAYDYVSQAQFFTTNCYLFAQTGDMSYITTLKQSSSLLDSLTDQYGKVMDARRDMPEKAGYSLVDILSAANEMETTTVN